MKRTYKHIESMMALEHRTPPLEGKRTNNVSTMLTSLWSDVVVGYHDYICHASVDPLP